MEPARKPLTKAPPMESKDERITVRVTPTMREALSAAAREAGDELARYCRDCLAIGHSMRESQKMLKRTVG